MARFVGIKNNKIVLVSDQSFLHDDLSILEIPLALSHIKNADIISSCIIKDGQIVNKFAKKPAKQLKIAFVGNYCMRCGISTYAENLWPQIAKYVKNVKLFIEENPFPTSNIFQFGES